MKVKDLTGSGDERDEEGVIELLKQQMQDTTTGDSIVLGTRGVPGELLTTEDQLLPCYTKPITYGLDPNFDVGNGIRVVDEQMHGWCD